MKRQLCIVMLISLMLAGCSCTKKNTGDTSESIAMTDMNQIVEMFESNMGSLKNKGSYSYYELNGNTISSATYDPETGMLDDFSYVFDDMSFTSGTVVVNPQQQFYISMENDQICAKKDFDSDEIEIYDISEKEKCDSDIVLNGDPFIDIMAAYSLTNKEFYYSDDVIPEGPISFYLISNIMDCSNFTYKWFRNGEEIPDSNFAIYTVTAEQEDAEYYFEAISPDGQTYTSSKFHLIIQK